jgi:hypothetical protein
MIKKQKLFIVRKYIMATSAKQALRKESKMPADEVWVDEDWKKNPTNQLSSAVGFVAPSNNEDE